MLILGFWADRNVPITKFKISYPGGRVVSPPFKKVTQADGGVIFKFKEPLSFSKGCHLSWTSVASFEAQVSPVFEPENEIEKTQLKIGDYQFRLMKFKGAFE